MAWNPQLGCAGTRWGCGCQEEAGTSPADPGNHKPAANGGASRHPGRAGSWPRPENKAPHLFLPSFRRQPLRAGLFLHFLCFSCLLGHPGADTHAQSRGRRCATGAAIEPAGTACPGPAWAGGMHSPPGTLSARDFEEGVPKGPGLSALPGLVMPGLVEGTLLDVRQSKHMGGRVYFTGVYCTGVYFRFSLSKLRMCLS